MIRRFSKRLTWVWVRFCLLRAIQLPRCGELVFHQNGKRIIYETAYSIVERACKKAGINRIAWHTFRKTFASNLVIRGTSLQAVKDLLGHATMNMTLRYVHLSPNVLRETISLLEPKPLKAEEMSTQRQPPEFSLEQLFMTRS